MKRKRKPKTPPPSPDQLSLMEYSDRVQAIIQDTNSDPDYERFKQIFAQLSRELETP